MVSLIIDPMSEYPLVGIVMGSKSDYEVLSASVEILRAGDSIRGAGIEHASHSRPAPRIR